jgi:hypothetical protein
MTNYQTDAEGNFVLKVDGTPERSRGRTPERYLSLEAITTAELLKLVWLLRKQYEKKKNLLQKQKQRLKSQKTALRASKAPL